MYTDLKSLWNNNAILINKEMNTENTEKRKMSKYCISNTYKPEMVCYSTVHLSFLNATEHHKNMSKLYQN